MGIGSMGMGMGVSIIGGTPVLLPVAKMMEAAAATSRGGGDRQSSRLDDRGRHGASSRWGGGDEVEDRWAGDSHSEDDRDHHHRAGGRPEDHHRRRRDSVGSGSRRSRADSRDALMALGQVSPPQEEEPEEGELVIDSSTTVLPTGDSPSSPPRRKSRWGNVYEGVSSTLGFEGSGWHPAPRRDSRPSRNGGHRSIDDDSAAARRDNGDGKFLGVTKGRACAGYTQRTDQVAFRA